MKKKIFFWTGTIFLGVIASGIYDKVKSIPLSSTLKNIVHWVWNIVQWIWNSVLCAEFKVWQILIGLTLILLVLLIYTKISQKKSQPKFLEYVSDKFDFYQWIWKWSFNKENNNWGTRDITPLCPQCETPMHYEIDYYENDLYKAKCPRCDFTSKLKPRKDIDALIIDNCRRENF